MHLICHAHGFEMFHGALNRYGLEFLKSCSLGPVQAQPGTSGSSGPCALKLVMGYEVHTGQRQHLDA